MRPPEIRLRPATEADHPFILAVYASTREPELALTDWDEAQKIAFCEQQLGAQENQYRSHYENATYSVILVEGVAAGRLYVARWQREIRIMEIALLPEHRGKGVGGRLLGDLLREGAESGRAVTIHVERMNPALRLYQRLGFRLAEDKGVYLFLRWEPEK